MSPQVGWAVKMSKSLIHSKSQHFSHCSDYQHIFPEHIGGSSLVVANFDGKGHSSCDRRKDCRRGSCCIVETSSLLFRVFIIILGSKEAQINKENANGNSLDRN